MRLADVQKDKLIRELHAEATSRGRSLSRFDISDAVAVFYTQREQGQPTAAPLIQEPRRPFNVQGYNNFMAQVDFDADVLISFINKMRIESRDLLVINDVKMKEFNQRVEAVIQQIKNFNAEGPSDSTMSIFSKTIDIPVRDFNPLFPDTAKACHVESAYGMVTLGELSSQSRDIDLRKVLEGKARFTLSTDYRSIRSRKTASPISSIAATTPTPWIEDILIDGQKSQLSGELVFTLPQLEQINKITLEPIPGVSSGFVVMVAASGDNYTTVGRFEESRSGKTILFPPKKVISVKIIISASPNSEVDGNSSFIMGLRSLKLSRKVYQIDSSLIVSDIDPEINDRRIISANLKVDQTLPSDSSSQYLISLNGSSKNNPLLQINGSPLDDSSLEFKVAKTKSVPMGELTRIPYTSRNKLEFAKLSMNDSNGGPLDLDTNQNVFLSRTAELWVEQNAFKELKQFNSATIEIQDAFTIPYEIREPGTVYLPLLIDRIPLRSDATGQFFELPLPLADNTVAPANPGATATDRMKDVDNIYGVYTVEAYKSSDPTVLTDFTSSCSVDDSGKVSVNLAQVDDDAMFRVFYLAKMTRAATVKQETVKAHYEYGVAGSLSENQINRTDNKFVFTDTNEFYLTDPGADILASQKPVFMNFTILLDIARLTLYETYITFPEFVTKATLTDTLYADRQAGEYITIRHLETGELVRLDGVQVLQSIEPGQYLLSVMSKPKSTQNTAIGSILDATIQPAVLTEDFTKLFDVRESTLISAISVGQQALQHRELTSLLNNSKRVGETTFSTASVNGELIFIVPESGYTVLPIGDSELYKLNLDFFDENLYADDVHTRLHLKMRLTSSDVGSTLVTPSVRGLQLKIKYI